MGNLICLGYCSRLARYRNNLNVTRLVEQRGGRYLARTSEIEQLEGERKIPQIFLIIEWPSKDVAKGKDSTNVMSTGPTARAAWRERKVSSCLWPGKT